MKRRSIEASGRKSRRSILLEGARGGLGSGSKICPWIDPGVCLGQNCAADPAVATRRAPEALKVRKVPKNLSNLEPRTSRLRRPYGWCRRPCAPRAARDIDSAMSSRMRTWGAGGPGGWKRERMQSPHGPLLGPSRGSLGAFLGSWGPSGALLGHAEAVQERFQDDDGSEPPPEAVF